MRKPAHVRATAPVAKFAVLLSLGSVLECPSPAWYNQHKPVRVASNTVYPLRARIEFECFVAPE